MKDFNDYFKDQTGDTQIGHDEETRNDLNAIKPSDTSVSETEDEASKMANRAGATDEDKIYTDEEYFRMVDPDTGKHYSLNLISPTMNGYRSAYISAMRMKVRDPKMFEKFYLNV